MSQSSIEERVKQLKKQFEAFADDPLHDFTFEPVSSEVIFALRSQDYFPYDMLLILEHLGIMRKWGHDSCAMIEWWIPSSIKQSMAEERSVYDLLETNFINSNLLLFFAWDCDAKCYFYDTANSPWKVLVCDGLDASVYNDNPNTYHNDWDGVVMLSEDPKLPDALSIIENWVNLYNVT